MLLPKLTKAALINRLREVGNDPESAHVKADVLLLLYIDDPEVTKAFEAIDKWYA